MNEVVIANSGSDYQSPGPIDDYPAAGSRLRLRRFLLFLIRFWWVPLITLALGLVAGVAYVHFKTPTFVSRASMWETVKFHLPEGTVFSEDSQNFIGTQSELLQSSTMQEQALQRLLAMTNTITIPTDKAGRAIPPVIRVSGSAKSSVFQIEATSSNPLYAQYYLNALMDAYLQYKRSVRQVVSDDTLNSISEQVQRWEQELKADQDALNAFESTNNLAVLQSESTVAGDYLANLKTHLSDLQLQERLLEATKSNQIASVTAGANPAALRTGPNVGLNDNPTGAPQDDRTVYAELELLKMQKARLSKYLRPKHPKIVKLQAEIDREQKLLEVYQRQNREELAASLEANQLKISNVMASIKEWETNAAAANSRIAEANRLKQGIQRVQSVYDRLVALVQNVGISRNIDQENVAILEHASPASRSYSDEKFGFVLALIGGLGSGLGIIYLIERRDDRFTSVTEANSTLGGTVVGMLPEVSHERNGEPRLLEANDNRHVYAESYRNLRSALMFLSDEGRPPKILLITSAMPNEGKSTVAANLARTLALAGARVLLVDADLRKGQLHRLLHLKNGPGLGELLHRTCSADEVVQGNSLPNFAFIPRGEASGHPGDLFLGSGLDQILARWREEYDYVIIDSTPLFAADDASCLAPKVDGTLFVVRRRHSSARAVQGALELLAQRQARVLGVVFNGVDASARSYCYYKYTDYYPSAKSA